MDKKFNEWNEVKKDTDKSKFSLGIKSREIYWTKIGFNVGHEEYGKGKEFVRPVIVIRQLTSDLFIGVPTTTSQKQNNDYFHSIGYVDKISKSDIKSSAMILQQKVFSKKRLLNKIGTLNKEDFEIIIDKLKRLIDPT